MSLFFRSLATWIIQRDRRLKAGILCVGLLFLLCGTAIIIAPAQLASIVAGFFLVAGIGLLIVWNALRN